MFWNNVKNLNNRISITLRLTLLYSFATFIILFAVSFLLYWGMLQVLQRADYQFLSDEINTIEHILVNKPNNLAALKQEVAENPLINTESRYRYFIRIIDDHHKIFAQTLENHAAFNPTAINNQFILMQKTASIPNNPHKFIIQVALDTRYQNSVVSEYRQKLLLILWCGTLVSLLLGFIVARNGMRKLRELTTATENITVNSLSQRIDPQSWPTELNQLGLAFNAMLNRIEFSVSQLSQLSADLAHELRTPINNLMGETELALSRRYSNEDYQQVLASNLEEFQRLSQIIENLLFLARSENPQYLLQKSPLNLQDELNLIRDYHQAMADEKNILIHSQIDNKINLLAHPVMFRRLLNNLLSNALKYTPSSGAIHFSTREDAHSFQILIKDNGIGIAAEHLPKIFHRFYRVDQARSQQSGGTGLGLAIVKSIADLHKWTIHLLSHANQGTTAVITIPKMTEL